MVSDAVALPDSPKAAWEAGTERARAVPIWILFFIVYNQYVIDLNSKYALFGACLLHGFCPISGLNLKTGPTDDP
ncbi:hypothetical protein [Desulfovibrio sp.]|uniref:hypothetical protein n=1 Tax=Desulfovibrio sp. TaxID=885 RepID=UPI0025BC35A5|nr:hypothetical protein [Desulfovibrio sp.]